MRSDTPRRDHVFTFTIPLPVVISRLRIQAKGLKLRKRSAFPLLEKLCLVQEFGVSKQAT
jgi:hypothetical protein